MAVAICTVLCGQAAAAPMQIDLAFGNNGLVLPTYAGSADNRSGGMAVQSDGKILVAGRCLRATYVHCISRFHSNGAIDSTFGNGTGQVWLDGNSSFDRYPVVVQPDGKILVGLDCGSICVERLTVAGDLDTSFGIGGVAKFSVPDALGQRLSAIVLDSADGVVVTAICTFPRLLSQSSDQKRFCAFRFNSNGSFDSNFAGTGVAVIDFGAEIQAAAGSNIFRTPEGDLLFGGTCLLAFSGSPRFCAVQITAAGQPVTRFSGKSTLISNSTLSVTSRRGATIVQTRDGQILVGGSCVGSQKYDACVVQHEIDGALDTSFGTMGTTEISIGNGDDIVSPIVLDDDRILLLGTCYVLGNPEPLLNGWNVCAALLSSKGRLDPTFATQGLLRQPFSDWRAASADVSNFVAAPDGAFLGAGSLLYSDATTPSGDRVGLILTRLQSYAGPDATCLFNVDGNLVTRANSDAMLIVRYLLGYRGAALTAGAAGTNATRTNAEIETYLGTLMQAGKLDVDGDGQSLAMTDGLLLVRAMLGLSGTALTNGATNPTHPNVRNAQQILTWIESTHGVACLP